MPGLFPFNFALGDSMSDDSPHILNLETKFADAGIAGTVRGLASPFMGTPDTHGDVIAFGAFRKSITEPARIPMLWSHDLTRPVGRWTRIEETDAGLMVEGKLNLDTAAGREAYEHLRHKDATGISIGYRIPEGGAERLGQRGRLLKEIALHEISFVTIPSADGARVLEVKTFETAAELKATLRGIGLSKSAAEKITRGGWPALAKDAADDGSDLMETLRQMRAAAAEFKGAFGL